MVEIHKLEGEIGEGRPAEEEAATKKVLRMAATVPNEKANGDVQEKEGQAKAEEKGEGGLEGKGCKGEEGGAAPRAPPPLPARLRAGSTCTRRFTGAGPVYRGKACLQGQGLFTGTRTVYSDKDCLQARLRGGSKTRMQARCCST